MVDIWKTLKEWSFKFFGRSLEPFVSYFESIKPDLIKANIGFSLNEYVYVMFFSMLILFAIEFPVLVIIMSIIFQTAALAFFFSFTLTVVVLLIMFFVFYTYPSVMAGRRKANIDAALPFAATYMGTIASSGAAPSTMFKVLSQFKDYGEVSKEAGKIHRDVEAFGMDLVGAIRKTAKRTPSEELKELLWGLDSVLTSGGNVGDYLHEKSRLFIAEFRRRLRQYSRTLSLLTEIYLTIVLVGSIFFILITGLMSIIGGGGEMTLTMAFVQFLIIFIFMPLVSVGFIILLKGITPSV